MLRQPRGVRRLKPTALAESEARFARLLALSVPRYRQPCDFTGFALYEAEGCRWLCSPPGAIQCAVALDDPARPVLPNQHGMLLAALLPDHGLERVLDLGSGGGGFTRALRARRPSPLIDCVESDPAMVELARRHFLLPADQAVHVEDARRFLAHGNAVYELIFCDLFRGRAAPRELGTRGFFQSLESRLDASGAVAINLLPDSEAELRGLIALAGQHFDGVGVLGFERLGNVVLLLSRRSLPSAADWKARLDGSCWRGDGVLDDAINAVVGL